MERSSGTIKWNSLNETLESLGLSLTLLIFQLSRFITFHRLLKDLYRLTFWFGIWQNYNSGSIRNRLATSNKFFGRPFRHRCDPFIVHSPKYKCMYDTRNSAERVQKLVYSDRHPPAWTGSNFAVQSENCIQFTSHWSRAVYRQTFIHCRCFQRSN